MISYKEMYRILFNGITDAIEDMERQNFGIAKDVLIKTQQTAEDIYIETDEKSQSTAPDMSV